MAVLRVASVELGALDQRIDRRGPFRHRRRAVPINWLKALSPFANSPPQLLYSPSCAATGYANPGNLIDGKIDPGVLRRFGHEQPRYTRIGGDTPELPIRHHTSQSPPDPLQPEFKPATALEQPERRWRSGVL
jgi:hypothetical protein